MRRDATRRKAHAQSISVQSSAATPTGLLVLLLRRPDDDDEEAGRDQSIAAAKGKFLCEFECVIEDVGLVLLCVRVVCLGPGLPGCPVRVRVEVARLAFKSCTGCLAMGAGLHEAQFDRLATPSGNLEAGRRPASIRSRILCPVPVRSPGPLGPENVPWDTTQRQGQMHLHSRTAQRHDDGGAVAQGHAPAVSDTHDVAKRSVPAAGQAVRPLQCLAFEPKAAPVPVSTRPLGHSTPSRIQTPRRMMQHDRTIDHDGKKASGGGLVQGASAGDRF